MNLARAREFDDATAVDSSMEFDDVPSFLKLIENLWSKLPKSDVREDSATDLGSATDDEQESPDDGNTIGRFRIVRELGAGAGGIVLLAFDPRLRREVALKVPGPEALASFSSRERFINEARFIAKLRHPNIVTVYEAGETGLIPYIVMDYLVDGSLASRLAEYSADRSLPVRWCAAMVAEIAEGVHHAHENGILHRDLKPGNILLQRAADPSSASNPERDLPRFVPKVTDFGLAKTTALDGGSKNRTVQGFPIGTLAYMSPEAARGDGAAIGPGADVYSLGVILYELLVGRTPFDGATQTEYLDKIRFDDPPPPRSLRPGLPRDIETICLACLGKSPGDRYASAAELASDLRRFLDYEPILRRRTPVWERAYKWAAKRPTVSVSTTLTVVFLAAVSVTWFIGVNRHADDLAREVASAEVGRILEIARRVPLDDRRITSRLDSLLTSRNPRERINAAIVLAPERPECRKLLIDRLKVAGVEEYPAITNRLLDRHDEWLPTFVSRLTRADDAELDGLLDHFPDSARVCGKLADQLETLLEQSLAPDSTSEGKEATDRTSAGLLLALFRLGRPERVWLALKHSPDPQRRSYLIHRFGPAGGTPEALCKRLKTESDASLRRALLLSLGEIPPSAWPNALMDEAGERIFSLYRDDPDPGVHGSAKWLLEKWSRESLPTSASASDLGQRMQTWNAEFPKNPPDGKRNWRITPFGLTMVAVPGSRFEAADTEITFVQYCRLFPAHGFNPEFAESDDCPVTMISFEMAAEYCNELSKAEGFKDDQLCYIQVDKAYRPKQDHRLLLGYRLPSREEAILISQAGAKTRRYFGDSERLLDRYAWYYNNAREKSRPVARLKPNDWGLFDTLGNAWEWVETSVDPRSKNQNLLGGSFGQKALKLDPSDLLASKTSITTRFVYPSFGFRVVRTAQSTPAANETASIQDPRLGFRVVRTAQSSPAAYETASIQERSK